MENKKILFRLKDARINCGKTQREVAADLNLSVQVLSRYERGEREADYKTLIKLAKYFNVTVDYLLGL